MFLPLICQALSKSVSGSGNAGYAPVFPAASYEILDCLSVPRIHVCSAAASSPTMPYQLGWRTFSVRLTFWESLVTVIEQSMDQCLLL